MRIFALLLFCATQLFSYGATVTGNIFDMTGSTKDGQILFHPTKPIVISGIYVSAVDRIVRSTNGVFSIYLYPNDYLVTVAGRAADQHKMSVPVGDGIYNWVDLLTSPITYVYLSPNAIAANGGTNTYQVKVSATDLAPGLLSQKLSVGLYLAIVTNNPGANETLQIQLVSLPAHTHSGADITAGTIDVARLAAPGVDNNIPFNVAGGFGSDTNLNYSPISQTLFVPKISTAQLTVNGTFTPPATAADTGLPGQMGTDGSFFYFCTATNTWKRWAISTW